VTPEGQAAWAAFGTLLRGHRRAHQLTQEALAERAGLSSGAVSLLERGRVEPRFGTVACLADALELTLGERRALEAAAEGGGTRAGRRALGARMTPAPRGRLRRPADSFVGREREVAAVRARLAEHRLVTLTGAGGVGKTRLAVEAAHALGEPAAGASASEGAFPDGVWLAELGGLADPDLVPQAVATAVGVELDPDTPPPDALADALESRRLLVVLDNCEHVVEACAALAEALLDTCPTVQVLATSREPLGCAGEAVVRVPSLALPPASGGVSVDTLRETPAVRLFVDRAGAVAPGFAVTGRNAPAVTEVCRRLDGIPLALEFAAKLVRGLSVEEIAARLDDRFRLLTGGSRTALSRQQTLRALVDWSYDLLAPAERALFVGLSVFAGAFTLEAAEAVCQGREALPATDVLAGLLRLVDTSFVLAEADGSAGPVGGARYRLLETLREYGRERLVAAPDGFARLRDRHLAYHLGLLEAASSAPAGGRATVALRQLEATRDDLWTALAWARDRQDAGADRRLAAVLTRLADRLTIPAMRHALAPLLSEMRRLELPAYEALQRRLLEQPDLAVLAAGVELYWIIGDHVAEEAVAVRRLRRLQGTAQDSPDAVRALVRYARVRLLQGGVEEGLALLDEAARRAEALGDDPLLLDVYLEQGYAHTLTADCPQGNRVYDVALTLLERLRPRLSAAAYRTKRRAALQGRGFVAHNADDNEACAACHQTVLDAAQEEGDGPEAARALLNLADAHWGRWCYGLALQTYDRAHRAATGAGYTLVRGCCVLGRGIVLWSVGRYAEAARDLQEGLEAVREDGSGWWIAYGLTYLSAVRASSGDLPAALDAGRAAVALAERHGVGYPLALARVHALWLQEVLEPGRREHAPQIEAAIRDAERLGLRGPTLHLRWVRLLHRVADVAVADQTVASELAAAVRAVRDHPPVKGAWELLGRDGVRALETHRPALDRAELVALVEWVVSQKAASLDPSDRLEYRETRAPWSLALLSESVETRR
jgi:predicted ATPase/transcriptional regulator with XRE-family HTH domain